MKSQTLSPFVLHDFHDFILQILLCHVHIPFSLFAAPV